MYFKDDEGRIIAFKEPVANKSMKSHVIRSAEVPSEGSCRLMCFMEPNCVSFNLGPLEDGKHKCELNNATDENQFPNSLVNKPAFTYLAIEVMSYKRLLITCSQQKKPAVGICKISVFQLKSLFLYVLWTPSNLPFAVCGRRSMYIWNFLQPASTTRILSCTSKFSLINS